MLAIALVLAFYLAFNLGANDVANAMGTSVGSKAITLGQAIAIAGVLELSGVLLLGERVSNRLISDIIAPDRWQASPQQWCLAMLAVLITTGLWLNLATLRGLPISSSHTVVGALTGTGLVAAGPSVIHWHHVGLIALAWIGTPLASGLVAALGYGAVQRWILRQPQPLRQLKEWIPWLSLGLFLTLGATVFGALIERTSLGRLSLPSVDLWLGVGALGVTGLSWVAWGTLAAPPSIAPGPQPPRPPRIASRLERVFARFQVTSASFVALAHGANDVGNAVAPVGAIAVILQTGQLPSQDFSLPPWILALGGVGIVAGLSLLGGRVIQTVGETLVELEPSSGFCAELATAATVLSASSLGFPVSTSHALVGAVVGVGWVKTGSLRQVGLQTLGSIGLAWGVTLPAAAAIAALTFKLLVMAIPTPVQLS